MVEAVAIETNQRVGWQGLPGSVLQMDAAGHRLAGGGIDRRETHRSAVRQTARSGRDYPKALFAGRRQTRISELRSSVRK